MAFNDRTNDVTPFVSTIRSRRFLSPYHSPIWPTLPETLFQPVIWMLHGKILSIILRPDIVFH